MAYGGNNDDIISDVTRTRLKMQTRLGHYGASTKKLKNSKCKRKKL